MQMLAYGVLERGMQKPGLPWSLELPNTHDGFPESSKPGSLPRSSAPHKHLHLAKQVLTARDSIHRLSQACSVLRWTD